MAGINQERPTATFFSEEATRQILSRISTVFNDPDLCDATFIVGDDNDREEIPAPSQFMALASPYFKKLFYPSSDNKRKEITGIQPQVFRKVLDYLFKGSVPLSSIEDAWKVKVAGRKFELEELEELVTKFLKYRLDATNLLTYLRNSTKYEAPDLREVILNRFAKEADAVLDDEAFLDLNQEDLTCLMQKQPICPAKKVVDVLIRWSRKRQNLDPNPTPAKRVCLESNGGVPAAEQTAISEEDKSAKPEQDIDLLKALEPFIKYVRWENKDADYFLKNVHGHKMMTEENENAAMASMLQSFIDNQPLARVPAKRGRQPGSGRGRGRGTHHGVGRGIAHHHGAGEFDIVMEKFSSHPGRGGIIKTEPSLFP